MKKLAPQRRSRARIFLNRRRLAQTCSDMHYYRKRLPRASLETDAALAGADGAGPHLAASVLRVRCLLGTQARGEAALDAAQSSEAGTRSGAATVDMEQLPPLNV